jgi:hypothetical protein
VGQRELSAASAGIGYRSYMQESNEPVTAFKPYSSRQFEPHSMAFEANHRLQSDAII